MASKMPVGTAKKRHAKEPVKAIIDLNTRAEAKSAEAIDLYIKCETNRADGDLLFEEARKLSKPVEIPETITAGTTPMEPLPATPADPPAPPPEQLWTKEKLNELSDYEFKIDANVWSSKGRVEAKIKVGHGHRLIVAYGPRRFCTYRLVAESNWWGGKSLADLIKPRPLGEVAEGHGSIQIKGVAYADQGLSSGAPELLNPRNYGRGTGARFPVTYVKVWWPDLAAGSNNKMSNSNTTWETRTVVRKLLGAKRADMRIYEAAVALEKYAEMFVQKNPDWESIMNTALSSEDNKETLEGEKDVKVKSEMIDGLQACLATENKLPPIAFQVCLSY